MSTLNKKWSELTKKEKQAVKTQYGDYAKQQWQDAKARAQGFKDEQDRRGNTGEKHRANNPNSSYSANSTNTSQASANSTASDSVNQASTNGLHQRLGLSADPNLSAEDISKSYGNIRRNLKMYGPAPDGRDIYASAGLKNPYSFTTEWQKDPDAFRKKYDVDNFEEVQSIFAGYDVGETQRKIKEEAWGGASFADSKRPEGMPDYQYAGSDTFYNVNKANDTLDRATINLDPESWGVLGQRVNDDDFKRTFDYSSPAPIIPNVSIY